MTAKKAGQVIFLAILLSASLISCQEDQIDTAYEALEAIQMAGLEAVRSDLDREHAAGRIEQLTFTIPSLSEKEHFISLYKNSKLRHIHETHLMDHGWYLYSSDTVILRIDRDIGRTMADKYAEALGLTYIGP